MDFPNNCRYTKDHEWIRLENDGTGYVGITEHAQDELGEIVFVGVETVGKIVAANDAFGFIDSVKVSNDLFMPVTGEVLEFNSDLDEKHGDNAGLINESPYDKGWIIRVMPSNVKDIDDLMDDVEYRKYIAR